MDSLQMGDFSGSIGLIELSFLLCKQERIRNSVHLLKKNKKEERKKNKKKHAQL